MDQLLRWKKRSFRGATLVTEQRLMILPLENLAQLFTAHSRKIATAFNIVLIILMSLTVANAVLVIMDAANPPSAKPRNTDQADTRRDNRTYKVSNLELFGKAEAVTSAPQVIDAPETRLNLELQGVFIADDESQSTAIVGEKNKTGELYGIGDRLPGNSRLAAVFVDHVLIRRGSRMEKLMFADTRYRIKKTNPEPRRGRTISGGLSDSERAGLDKIRDRVRNRSASVPVTQQHAGSRRSVAEVTNRLKNNPVATLGEAGITAVAEGESKGYRIGQNAQDAIRQAGLQPGDVILSVNGRPVGSAANDQALIDQVMASSRVRVEVKRGSRRFFLTVPVPR